MATEAIGFTARAFREALGLSQAAVGRLLGIRGDQVRRIENRQRSVSLGEAAVLAREFGIPLEVLADVDLARAWLADMFTLVSNLVTDLAAEEDGPQPTSGVLDTSDDAGRKRIQSALFDMEQRLTEHRRAERSDKFIHAVRVMVARRDFGAPALLDEARADAILRTVQTKTGSM